MKVGQCDQTIGSILKTQIFGLSLGPIGTVLNVGVLRYKRSFSLLAPPMNALILVNPHAAGGRARKLHLQLLHWCQDHAAIHASHEQVQVLMPESIAQALHVLAELPSPTRVIVVGGDGTLNQMLPGLFKGHHEVGLVPYGSGNDCARAWGLHRMTWQAALAFALSAPSQAMDVGCVTLDGGQPTYFHSSLAVGFDASVGHRALGGPTFLSGLARYLLATFRELVHLRNWPVRVRLNGLAIEETTMLLASSLNTPSYGGGMPAVPHAHVQGGQLHLLLAGRFNRLQTLLMLPRLLLGLHLSHPRITCRPFTQAELSSPEALPVAADGETLGHAKQLRIGVMPNALQVVMK